jgi:molybdopterin-containing oxidoreductase family membrane subunit
VVFVVAILVNVGMWAERFVIIVLGLEQDFLPSAWATYTPTIVDLGLLFGTISFFLFLFLLFLRFVPFVPLAEVKELTHELANAERHPPGGR